MVHFRPIRAHSVCAVLCILAAAAPLNAARAEPRHGIAMYGDPALADGFAALPYANPDAPKGGAARLGEVGGFDSLNPYIVSGRAPWAMRTLVFESLMIRSYDEPFTLYGLLAESIDLAEDRSSVVFTLRPEAKFSNGDPVTPADVIWSIETLVSQARPNYAGYYGPTLPAEQIGDSAVRFNLPADNREAVMLLGLAPIFSKSAFEGRAFDEPTLDPLIGSGPYVVGDVASGRAITFNRNEDYWAADLPAKAGQHNFDSITYLYFKDADALWQAFRAGDVDKLRDGDPARWANEYDFSEVADGQILREEIPHGRPTGMEGFVFNTRRPIFADRRVRDALTLAFDYDFANQAMFAGGYGRITSFFGNSQLGFSGAAEGRERAILEPFADDLPEGTLDAGYTPPSNGGDRRNRTNLRAAARMLRAAGWTRGDDGVLVNAEGDRLAFDILLSGRAHERVSALFVDALKQIGVAASYRVVDGSAYYERLKAYDFDMIVNRWWMSLSPGAEQRLYWGDEAAGRDYAGVDSPAVNAAVDALLNSEAHEDFQAAARALDRALVAGRYVIGFGVPAGDRFAWRSTLTKPDQSALYGYRPEVWWSTEAE